MKVNTDDEESKESKENNEKISQTKGSRKGSRRSSLDFRPKRSPVRASQQFFDDDKEERDRIHRMMVRAPDGGWGWLVVLCSFFCNLIVDGIQFNFGNLMEPLQTTFNSNLMEISLIGSLLTGFYNFSGPIGSALANKFGFRMVVICGSVIGAIGLSTSYFALNTTYLCFTYGMIGGLGFGMIYMASVIATSMYFVRLRALATSISVCGTGMGTFIFSPFGHMLISSLGWRLALVCEGGLILLCILFGLVFKPLAAAKNTTVQFAPSNDSTVTASSTTLVKGFGAQNNDASRNNSALPTIKQALLLQQTLGTSADIYGSRRTLTSFQNRQLAHPSVIFAHAENTNSNESEEEISSKPIKRCCFTCRNSCRQCCFNCWHCRCRAKRIIEIHDRPMYRDDIFYEGSLSRLPNYSIADPLNYHMSVIRVPADRDTEQQYHQKCCVCHEAVLHTCATMTGLNLFKSSTFVFLCISSFLFTMGVYTPYVFIRQLADDAHMTTDKAVWLVSSMGISNTLGRIISGILASFTKTNSSIFVVVCTLITGAISFLPCLHLTTESLFLFSSFFGFFSAPFISLRPILLVEFLGLERLTNAFGLVLLTQGIASVIGPPLAGLTVTAVGDSSHAFMLSGCLILASAIAMTISSSCHLSHKRQKRGPSGLTEEEDESDYVIEPPNGGWGWVIVFSAFYCNVVADGIQFTFGVFLNKIADEFEVDKSKIALVGSLMFGFHLIMGPICAGLSNTFGIRPVTVIGSAIAAVAMSLAYFTTRYETLYLTCGVVVGMGLGLVYMNTLIITSLYFSSLRAFAIGIVVCGTGFGTVTFALAAHYALQLMTWRTAFALEGALAATMIFAGLTFKPLIPIKVITTTSVPPRKLERIMSVVDEEDVSGYEASRRATRLYLKRAIPRDSVVSAYTLNMFAFEQVATQAAAPQTTAHIVPNVIRQCCRRCCRRCGTCCCDCCDCCTPKENVMLINPETKLDLFPDVSYLRSRNASLASSVYQQLQDLQSRSGSDFVFSKLPTAEPSQTRKYCLPLKEAMVGMFNCSLLSSLAFSLFVLSGSLSMAALITVFTYETGRAMQHGIPEDMAIFLVVTLGGANMFWRFFLGLITTMSWVNHHYINVSGLIIGGLATAASGLSDNIYYQFAYCVVLAFGMGSFAVFRPVILVELMGMDEVVNATGISLMFMGLAAIVIPPLCGSAMELTNNYDTIYYIAGGMLCVSGFMQIGITNLREKELRRMEARELSNGLITLRK